MTHEKVNTNKALYNIFYTNVSLEIVLLGCDVETSLCGQLEHLIT